MNEDLSLMTVVSTLKYIGDISLYIASVFGWLMRIQMLQRLSILLSVMRLMKEIKVFWRIL